MSKKFINFASGWISKNKEGVVSFMADSTRTKYKLILEDENGNQVQVNSFFCRPNEKQKDNHPDYQATFVYEG